MKKLFLMTILAALAAGSLRAQDQSKFAFPNPGQPRKLVVESLTGNVTVRGYEGQEVIVETSGSSSAPKRNSRSEPPPGMHRIGPSNVDLNVLTQDNTITIKAGIPRSIGNMVIQVPVQTSVSVKAYAGREIRVENVNGEIEANNMNGQVNILNVSGSVVAHSMNGKVTASLNALTPGKTLSFSSFNGNVDVTLPSAVKANVKLKTDRGDMFTDFDIRLNPTAPATTTTTTDKNGKRVRVRADRSTIGTINGGGQEIQFTSYNGDILIHKK